MKTLYYMGSNPRNQSGVSWKMWKVQRRGRTVTIYWGRATIRNHKLMPAGSLTAKSFKFRAVADAQAELAWRVERKLAKGYAVLPRNGRPVVPSGGMTQRDRAISIRQPFVELILRGKKTKEFRSQPTHIQERVYLYASLQPCRDPREWRKVGKQPGELPTGAIVGTVEIAGCKWDGRRGCYAYNLRKPRRTRQHLAPTNQPQPVFWRPAFD